MTILPQSVLLSDVNVSKLQMEYDNRNSRENVFIQNHLRS